ncbi:penicillin-binding protein 2 [Fusobacterium ulcerans]|jgi:penicillin-binding protein 2|uniref:Penicillin-binding protein A n=1 Tax=Fusobacterium ulcerans TaxID=861 RepID=A0AAX2JDV5_9FUSO|nr:penicillin-binding protein 2 [Fusobacterium ulcerans]AVQ29627.1 penicillin-binding protein 2 [Fusobacterium ulcerans]EFS24517.2 penicillin-binding protein 2 [Fusobacterium ulcerans ATCC 49185]SQJ12558.1 Penicillin-binding protein A [Fusobacterium ulcerans]
MKNGKIQIKLGSDNSKRDVIFKVFILLVFLGLGSRMMYLQLVRGDRYAYLSEKNRFKLKKIESPRGKIYDRDGRLVVTNGAGYRLVYLKERDNDPEIVREISEVTGYDEDYIKKRIRNGEIFPYTRENVLIESLDEETAHKLMEKIVDYPYLQVQTYSKRRYLYDSVASHSIGYVKKISEKEYEKLKDEGYSPRDIVGKDGIERAYDKQLQGEDGYEYIEVNAFNKVQRRVAEEKDPVPGKDLYMTLDMELQEYMEEQFKEDGRVGAFIAMDPKTGGIITMVSYPTYSLNMFSSQILNEDWQKIITDPGRPLTNKAIAGEYPPGSVFKVVSAMAFLDSGIDPKEKYLDKTGYYEIGKWRWRAWKVGGHGYVDMKKSIVESANPYYYRLSDQVGHKPIVDTARLFGINEKTGIDIPGEKRGLLPDTEWKKKVMGSGWYKGDTILLSIGQGYLTVTPLQIAVLYATIANKGYVYSPHLVKELVDFSGKNVTPITGEKHEITKFPKKYYDELNEALIATVAQDNGTTKILRTPGMKVAAKSGSAQNPHSKTTHAWVAGYFPADNPEIVFSVILEGAGGGGAMGGAMARKFIDKYLEIKDRDNAINGNPTNNGEKIN